MSKRIELAPHLFLDEYIPQRLYRLYEQRPQILIGLLDRRLIEADRQLRQQFGPVTINNWWAGGDRNWSGIRQYDSPYFSPASQHTFGRASDKVFRDATADEVREFIKSTHTYLGITCIEDRVSWVHSDVRYTGSDQLLIVQP